MLEAHELSQRLLGFPNTLGMAAINQTLVHFPPRLRFAQRASEPRPIDHDDLLRVTETGPDLSQVGIPLLHAFHRADQAHRRAINVAASKIQEQALPDGHEAKYNNVVAADG